MVGIMLAQVLEMAGHRAQCVPQGTAAEMLAQVKEEKPDIVCISALPPFAIPHARSLYARLRAQNAKMRIMVGLWNFTTDPAKVGLRLGLSESAHAFSTLAQLRQELQAVPEAVPVPAGAL
jgi:methanogenic corrinoid protein MtbC1